MELEGKQPEVVLIPHRRGDDGYFLLQLLPSLATEHDRDLVADGAPLNLLLVADTSASMDRAQRERQEALLQAILNTLTPKDTFNLAACDVECDWVFPQALPVDQANIDRAWQFLHARASLGWTDLDKAFAAVVKQTEPHSQVLYLGDGIITTGDADPVAFGKRLRKMYQDAGRRGTFHAVTVGNSFEPGVLKAVASLGGGSCARVSSDQGPQSVALELLSEMTRPVVRDLKVEFKGLRTNMVYPEELPNLPAGMQQILLGRYLPEGRDQVGSVLVSGSLGDKKLQFEASVSLKDAEQGNSFIPRLWARMHLDRLLERGVSETVKDEIIALSEEYQIITPYTSFLVLETDADRERFKVKRRFQMRDGERYFAQGRDNANYELLQKQMKLAGEWRLGMRRMVLARLATLGRKAGYLESPRVLGLAMPLPTGGVAGVFFDYDGEDLYRLSSSLGPAVATSSMPASGEWAGGYGKRVIEEGITDQTKAENSLEDGVHDEEQLREEPAFGLPPVNGPIPTLSPVIGSRLSGMGGGGMGGFGYSMRGNRSPELSWQKDSFLERSKTKLPARIDQVGQWLNAIFPQLPDAVKEHKPPQSTWPDAARQLAQSLLRRDILNRMKGGVLLVRQTDTFDTRWDKLSSRAEQREVYSPVAWLTRSQSDGSQTLINWCDGKERGVWSVAFQLGRVRASTPQDLREPPLGLSDFSLAPLDQTYAEYIPTLQPQGEGRTLLTLRAPNNPHNEIRFLVDTVRHVLLSMENCSKGKVTGTTTFSDFVEVVGCWWARKVETTSEKGRRASLTTQTVEPLFYEPMGPNDKAALAWQMAQGLVGKDQVLFLHQPLPSLVNAKRNLAAGKASFEDHFTLLLHFAQIQQWTRVTEQLARLEEMGRGKPGLSWLHDAVLNMSRRHEELKQRILQDADCLAQARKNNQPRPDEQFLADHLVGQAGSILEANEILGLLDRVQSIYAAQPAYLEPLKRWKLLRANYLQGAGQSDTALSLRKELAEQYPHDSSLHQQYANALVNVGEYQAAYAWLQGRLTPEARWSPSEEESLRNQYADFLEQQGRYQDQAEYLGAWTRRNPESESPYRRYLTALIKTGQENTANTLIAQWLREGQVEAEPAPAVAARLNSAVNQALGQGYNTWSDRIEERWLRPLADAALFFSRHADRLSVAGTILNHNTFERSDECRRVRRALTARLVDDLNQLTHEQISSFVSWVLPDDPTVGADSWKKIAADLQNRWSGEKDEGRKHDLGQTLARVLQQRVGTGEWLAFLHRQLREGPAKYRISYVHNLFQALLDQPWSIEYEDEAFALLEKLSDAEEPEQRLAIQVRGLYRFTDRMLAARQAARLKPIEHPEKLTRTELTAKRAEALKMAREGLSERFQKEQARVAKLLAPWVAIERLTLETLMERNLSQVAAQCWDFLGTARKPIVSSDENALENLLEDMLRDRYVTILSNLATRKGTAPALVERLLKVFDAGIAGKVEEDAWKVYKVRLLVALDRPRDLEQALQEWIKVDDPDNRWRQALGLLLAEQGRVPEAIRMFEAIEKADELGAGAYRTLADWYLAANQREKHERTLLAAYRMLDENQMYGWLYRKLNPWLRQDGPLPTELDPDVMRFFTVLFEKSSSPQNYLGQLQQFYQACRDFRLLAVLADSVVGHSAGKVYPFLQGMQGVLGEIRDEATVDQLCGQIAKVRVRAQTPVDHRALDLLEALVRRRAAELKNQPGPHGDAALASLQRAFKRAWTPGEPRLMGQFLAGMKTIAYPALTQEQLRELEVLHREAARGSFDRLDLAHSYASTLGGYERKPEAIALLQANLREFQEAHGGVLPVSANNALDTLISFLETTRQYVRGEDSLNDQLRHPVHQQQRFWLALRLDNLHYHALTNDGGDSLGKGEKLYQSLHKRITAELDTHDDNHRYNLINLLCSVYQMAHNKKLPGVVEDLRSFAFQRLPHVLERQTNNYNNIVTQVANTVYNVAGPARAVAFLVGRIENEPAWLRFNRQDGWSQHAYNLGRWREEAKNLGDAEQPLLRLVSRELRRDLETRQSHTRYIYHPQWGFFWKEKTDAFAQVAEAVLAQQHQSGAGCQYVADYFFWGLDRHGRAIDILADAYQRQILDEGGQAKLVDFLHRDNRYAESIPLLQPMIEVHPENLQYRVWMMSAYFHTQRFNDLLTQLSQTDVFFHQKERWTEQVMATLAQSCLDNQLYAQAVSYAEPAIKVHKESGAPPRNGDGVLSNYYTVLARAQAGLKHTPQAVDAAGAAIVSWGPDQRNRANALETLRQVLRDSPNLDAFVVHLDKDMAETHLVNPVVRKAVGEVYHEQKKYVLAAVHLQLAAEAQPSDLETQKLLLSCYDKLDQKEPAIAQILQTLQTARRDIKQYQDLGRRYTALDRAKEAERAYTSLVEVLPNESEGHALLAEVRQEQDRWNEALSHWQQVVRIRALEPEGWLKLAAAQIHQRQWEQASATLEHLSSRSWPARFQDVPNRIRELKESLKKR